MRRFFREVLSLCLVLAMLMVGCMAGLCEETTASAEETKAIAFEPTLTKVFDYSAQEWFSSSANRALLTIMLAVDLDVFDPHVLRASMGAFYKLRVHTFDAFEDYRALYPDRPLYPFMLDGAKSLNEVAAAAEPPFSLVFGNEASGLPARFAQLGQSVLIPQSDEIDSLNLAVAVSVGSYVFMHGGKNHD